MLSEDNISENGELVKLVKICLTYWKSIVAVALLVLILVALYVIQLPFEYRSQTTIFPSIMLRGQESSFQAGLLAGVSRQFGINFGAGAADQSIMYESMLKSRRFLERILESEFVDRNGDTIVLMEFLVPEEMDHEKKLFLAYEIFLVNGLRVHYKPETEMTTISVISLDPVIAASVCNSMVVEFEKYTHDLLSKNSSNYAKFIEERIIEVTNNLTRSEIELSEFLKNNRVTNSSPALSLQHTRLQREVMLQQQLFLSLKEQYELANIDAEKDISKISVLDKAIAPIAKFRPRRSIYLVFGLLFGGLLGMVQALVRYYIKNSALRPG